MWFGKPVFFKAKNMGCEVLTTYHTWKTAAGATSAPQVTWAHGRSQVSIATL